MVRGALAPKADAAPSHLPLGVESPVHDIAAKSKMAGNERDMALTFRS